MFNSPKASFGLICLLAVFIFAHALPAQAQMQPADTIAPEAGLSATGTAPNVRAQNFMVAAANPIAVQAGIDILTKGGTAADAMIAVQAVLGLVEPQSSGLGGGGFVLYFDANSKTLISLDGRETAPLSATPDLFLNADGSPMAFAQAMIGGLSVGSPSTPMLLETLHQRFGKLAFADLFQHAIALSEQGFAVSPRLANAIAAASESLSKDPASKSYFFLPSGKPLPEGHVLQNPAYATSLRALATQGSGAFYTGEQGQNIVDAVQGASWNPGRLEMADLAAYTVKERPPVCIDYRAYEVCGMGPPSSGGIAIAQILGVLENFDLKGYGQDNPTSWRLLGDATRLAFADRGRYVADSDFITVPVAGLIDKVYLAERAQLLDRDTALEAAPVGSPAFSHGLNLGDDLDLSLPATSHISIFDSFGNVAVMTSSIENGFGARIMANGYLLNNQLTDFSFKSHDNGLAIANAVAPAKRPRSSMSPTIVLQNGQPIMALGSPGGSRIIPYVAQALVGLLEWDLSAGEVASQPHMLNRFGTYDLEAGTPAIEMQQDLQAMGYKTNITDLNSGLHIIVRSANGLQGAADPRREGIASGQ